MVEDKRGKGMKEKDKVEKKRTEKKKIFGMV